MQTPLLSLLLSVFLPLALPVLAADAGEVVSLFNGKTLSGWKTPDDMKWVWSVEGAVIRGASDSKARGHELWTEKEYGDFVLEVDWRFPDAPQKKLLKIILPNGEDALNADGSKKKEELLFGGDSGILIRGEVMSQINISCKSAGSGELYGYRKKMPGVTPELKAACVPSVRADKPPGEWNHFVITARSNHVSVELNGKLVIKEVELPGLPARGAIALQHHGEGIEFRNVSIKEN